MKKLLFGACALCLLYTANAAWNQECFYGKCCINGVLSEECLNPIEVICHKKCIDLKGPAGGEFIACKEECVSNNGIIEAEEAVIVQPVQPVKKTEPQKEIVESSRKARLAVGRTFRIEGDQFPFPSNSDVPPAALKEHIKEKAGELKELSYSKVIVTGYTDSTGNVDYNNDLSKRRAEAVRTEFIKNGVPADKVETVGKGPQNPIADNKTAEGRKANRRVEITVK
jgi:outer membrane protein OmpA-like peptidoglycan-associated protein